MKQFRLMPILAAMCVFVLAITVFGVINNTVGQPSAGEFDVYLGNYKHVVATVDTGEITDEVVEANLQDLLTQAATEEEIKGSAKSGDRLVISYIGTSQGQADPVFESTEEEYTIGGENNLFPLDGLDDAVTGAKKGDEIKINLTVPEDYHVSDFVGIKVNFSVTVHSVTRIHLPDLDDAFAQTQGFTNVAALRQSVRDRLQVIQDALNDMIIRDGVWQEVIKQVKVLDPHTEEVEAMKTELLAKIESEAESAGLDTLGYATFFYQFDGSTAEELDHWAANQMWSKLKEQMVSDALCRKEGITLSQSDYETMVNDAIEQNKKAGFTDYTKQNLMEDMGVADEEGLKEYFLWVRITDRLLETATVIQN